MTSALTQLLDRVPSPWLYAVTFLVAFGESAPAFGLLIPGQTILFAVGFASGEGLLDPVALAGLVAVGSFIGDCLGYVLGRRYGLGPLRVLPQRVRPGAKAQARLGALFDDHGMKAVVLSRFQPIGRAFGPYFAGLSGMPVGRFVVAAAIASIAAGVGLIGLGYLAGLGFERLSRTLGVVAVSIVTLLLVLIVALGLRAKHKKDGTDDVRP